MKYISREVILSVLGGIKLINESFPQADSWTLPQVGDPGCLGWDQESTGSTSFPGNSAVAGLVPTLWEIELQSWEARVEVKIKKRMPQFLGVVLQEMRSHFAVPRVSASVRASPGGQLPPPLTGCLHRRPDPQLTVLLGFCARTCEVHIESNQARGISPFISSKMGVLGV